MLRLASNTDVFKKKKTSSTFRSALRYATGQTESRPGDVPGDVPGNVPGDVPGDVSGDVPGDVPGNISGDVPGDVIRCFTWGVGGPRPNYAGFM